MKKDAQSYILTKDADRFLFFKLLCSNLEYIYNFQQKFSSVSNRINTRNFSTFFNSKYKDKLTLLINTKNKELFEHLDHFRFYEKINTEGALNFYYSNQAKNTNVQNQEFRCSYAKRCLGNSPKLYGIFSNLEKRNNSFNDFVKEFIFGFYSSYDNFCLNSIRSQGGSIELDGGALYQLDNGNFQTTFLDFFIIQSLALQSHGLDNNIFPGSNILKMFGDDIVDDYLEDVKKQNEFVYLPEIKNISDSNNEIYNWSMEKGLDILKGKTYKFEDAPALSFLNKAGQFEFRFRAYSKNDYVSEDNYLSSRDSYKEEQLLALSTSRDGHINTLTYGIDKISFNDLLRMGIKTARSGNFLENLSMTNHSYHNYNQHKSFSPGVLNTKERLTYLLPMLAAQIQSDSFKIDYSRVTESLIKEIEFFRNCTALYNCFMEKNKTSLLINTI